jgi:DNA segregation ATPase FtsK/SpoIIIE, S-DNA-T family
VEQKSVGVDATRRDQLWFRLTPEGPSWDLVSCGPHAVVWGATGSGKSVAAVTLISSLVNRYSPKDLALVVIDFKGGAGLSPLRTAPHTIGWVTDLDLGKSQRVMVGLRSEMVKREQILATWEVSDLSKLPSDVEMPRLLVVVDELAWLLTNHPEWADALADVLARGRSLGIHVVLSTQRVSGVLSRTMMANIALRLCGVVRDEQELSEWMPGVSKELARGAPRMKPGEVVISAGDAYPERQEVRILTPTVGSESPGTWRVWVDDLPTRHPWTATSFGVVECVETQTHQEASYRPGDGSVLIVGDGGSGRTAASYAMGGLYESVWLAPAHAAETWLALRNLSGTTTAVIIDDVDVLLQGAGVEGEAFLLDALENFRGTLILSVKPEHRVSRTIARLAPHTLLLSIAKSEQAALWNARVTTVPGRGMWRGDCVQVGWGAPEPTRWSSPPTSKNLDHTIVVTEDASTWVDYPVHSVLSMDQFTTARTQHTLGSDHSRVVWDQVSHREVRFATGGTTWIPPLEPPEDTFWMTSGGGLDLVRPVDWLH